MWPSEAPGSGADSVPVGVASAKSSWMPDRPVDEVRQKRKRPPGWEVECARRTARRRALRQYENEFGARGHGPVSLPPMSDGGEGRMSEIAPDDRMDAEIRRPLVPIIAARLGGNILIRFPYTFGTAISRGL